MKLCSHCSAQLADDAIVCTACSQPQDATQIPAKKPVRKKILALLAGGLAVLLLLVVLLVCLPGKEQKVSYAAYHKDGKVYLVDFESKEPIFLTEYTEAWRDVYAALAMEAIVSTPDGKYVFYPDEVKEGDSSMTLLYRDVHDPDAKPVKMASKVIRYFVANDSDTVFYKTIDKELLRYRISTGVSETVSENVSEFFCSEDGQNILYSILNLTEKDGLEKKLYRVLDGNLKKPMELPDQIRTRSDDLSIVAYKDEDGKFYIIDENGETSYIDTDVSSFWITEDHSVYYTKITKTKKLSAFIENDLNDDSRISPFNDETITYCEFYKFDGDPVLVAENITRISHESSSKPIFSYIAIDPSRKLKLSELPSEPCEAIAYVSRELQAGDGLILDDECTTIDCDEIYEYAFSEDCDRIYVLGDWNSDDRNGTLYVADVNRSHIGRLKKVDDGVTRAIFAGNHLFYYKEQFLYAEGEDDPLCENVFSVKCAEGSDTVYVGYDMDDQGRYSKIGYFDGDEIVEIGRVLDFILMENGALLYTDEFSHGTWFYFANGESVEIGDEITPNHKIPCGGYGSYYELPEYD